MGESKSKISYLSKLVYNYDTKSNENSCNRCKGFINREQTLKKWEENLRERECFAKTDKIGPYPNQFFISGGTKK